jgi:hypothetical protein
MTVLFDADLVLQVPNYHNDFPDWDQEEWAFFVLPSVPHFFLYALVAGGAVLVATIVYVVRKRQASATRGEYAPIGDVRADRATSWL